MRMIIGPDKRAKGHQETRIGIPEAINANCWPFAHARRV